MPDLNNHLNFANRNDQFSQDLVSEQRHLDWAVTVMFYAAVHYVETYFAMNNLHDTSHIGREGTIHRDRKLRRIYAAYRELKDDSVKTRYECHIFPAKEIVSRIQPNLLAIKNHISGLLV